MIRLLVLFGAGLFIGLVFGFGLGRWLLPGRDDDEPESESDYIDPIDLPVMSGRPYLRIDPPGPVAKLPAAESEVHAGPGAEPFEGPAQGSDWYRWANLEPLRRDTRPITVIDWDRVSWADAKALEAWDWAQRMHAWVEDWDRDQLEAA